MNGSNREENEKMEECKETVVYMWGYLPGILPEKSPILSPLPVRLRGGDSWKDVCGGGCGFALATSESGKLITWGSADDEGQIYLTSGKHGETPEPFPLPTEASVVKAAAGWAHCVSVTEAGEVYTWGWKECVPSAKVTRDFGGAGSFQKDTIGKRSAMPMPTEQAPHSDKRAGEEVVKRRKMSPAREESENPASRDEFFTLSPCLVTLNPGVKITKAAAGGRHTLILSGKSLESAQPKHLIFPDMGQVWGWGYGGEGQLGLGSRIKMVPTPHLIPCLEHAASGKDRCLLARQGSVNSSGKGGGSYVKEIACGGRHSALVTDTGALLTFGWGLYGQCGHGSTNDQLRPSYVSSLMGIQVEQIAAGLWHTVCISVEGRVYVFGGNQFGQLGTGADHAEIVPKLLETPILESKCTKLVSCGARHSAVLTEDGQVLSWGWNKYGQLGLGDSIDRNIPSLVPIDGFLPRNIACGWWHTLLLAETTQI